MEPTPEIDIGALTTRLGDALLRDRSFVLGLGPLAAITRQVAMLRDLGAHRPLVLARGLGTGPAPDPADADVRMVDARIPTSLSDDLHLETALLQDPPRAVIQAVEAYDPDGSAYWLVAPHFGVSAVAGRPVLAPRRDEWVALEDKTRCDELFDACGVRRAPSVVVEPAYEPLQAAAKGIDEGAGTVWSGDAREGQNGGAELVRWVRTDQDGRAAVELFAPTCDRVRVAPFVDGVPCSIHGIVMPDGVAALRPVEMVMLRRGDGTFEYAGMSTWWDPPPADREVMRDAARRVGAELSRLVDFRGGFSVDGVLGAAGWVPTEVNTRFSGGMAMLSRALPAFPLFLLQLALVEGVNTGIPATAVELTLVRAADAARSASLAGFTSHAPRAGEETIDVADGTITFGSSMIGGMVRLAPGTGAIGVGDRAAPLVLRALALANRTWGTAFAPATAAPDVR